MVDSFLNAYSEEGRHLGVGEFSLNSLKARRKLSQFQLPAEELWVVKLVQAAVVSGAPLLEISFGHKKVSVRFQPLNPPRASRLLELVMSGELPKERQLLHLVTGLRAGALHLTEKMTWRSSGEKVTLNGDSYLLSKEPDDGAIEIRATRPSRGTSLGLKFRTPLAHLVRQTAYEYEAVVKHCCYCPIPVKLDGRFLNRDYGLNPQNPKSDTRKRFTLGVRPVKETLLKVESDDLCFPLKRDPGPRKPQENPLLIVSWPPEKTTKAVVGLYFEKPASPTVGFLLDGVLIKSVKIRELIPNADKLFWRILPHTLNFHVLVQVKPQYLDISQFEISDLELDFRAILEHLLEMVTASQEAFKEVKFNPLALPLGSLHPKEVTLGRLLGVSAGLLWLGPALPILLPGMLVCNLALKPLVRMDVRRMIRKSAREIRKVLEESFDDID